MTNIEAAPGERGSIGRQARRGLRWSLVGTAITKVGSLCMGLVLARLLAPADFGVYAVALAAMHFVMHVNDVGLIAATVQWRGKLAEMAPTATTLALGFSVLIYAGFWFAAPMLAALAGIPEATPVIRLLTVVILIDGVTAVRSAALMRDFRQDKLIIANLVGLVAQAGTAIGLALAGGGAFAFIGGHLVGTLLTGVLVVVFARLPFAVGLDLAVARRLLRFGVPLAASLGVEAILMNADFIIVGRVLGASALGYYLLAFNISNWPPSVIGSAIRYVSIAGFSRLSEGDADSMTAGVQRTLIGLITAVLPIGVLLAVLAEPVILVLYGYRWAPAALVLHVLVVLTVVRMLISFIMDILMGSGATRWALWINLGWSAALVPALLVGTRLGGLVGAAVAHAVVGIAVAVPLALLALHRTGVRVTPIGPALVRPLLAGAVAGVVALLVARVSGPYPFVQLAVAGTAGLLAYVAVAARPEQHRRWFATIRREEAIVVD